MVDLFLVFDWTSLDCWRWYKCWPEIARSRYWFNVNSQEHYIVGFPNEHCPFQGTGSQNSSTKMSKSPNGIGRLVERWPTKEEAVNVRQEFEEEQPAAKIAHGFTVPVVPCGSSSYQTWMEQCTRSASEKSLQKIYRAWYCSPSKDEQRRWFFQTEYEFMDATDGYSAQKVGEDYGITEIRRVGIFARKLTAVNI